MHITLKNRKKKEEEFIGNIKIDQLQHDILMIYCTSPSLLYNCITSVQKCLQLFNTLQPDPHSKTLPCIELIVPIQANIAKFQMCYHGDCFNIWPQKAWSHGPSVY